MIRTIVVLLLLAIGSAAVQAQDAAAGADVFKKCMSCHSVGENARAKVGPPLNGIVDHPAGTVAGFKYSQALLDAGITWDAASLAAFLADPRDFLPGTKMSFAGLKKEEDLANVIAYLATFGPDGKPVE